MSHEVYGDNDDMDDWVTNERAEELFVAGAQACREMMARFLEQGGHPEIAQSIRANWHPSWGNDPGKLEGDIPQDCWSA